MAVVHDIFGDNSALATYTLNSNVLDLGGVYDGVASNISYDTQGKEGECATFNADLTSNIWVGSGISAFKILNHSISTFIYLDTHNQTDRMIVNNHTRYAGSGNTYNSGTEIAIGSNDKIRTRYAVLNDETVTDSNGFTQTNYVIESQSSQIVPTGRWVHIVANFYGTHSELYIDGVLDATVSSAQQLRYSTLDDNFSIGVLYYDSAKYYAFLGKIDHTRLINKTVTKPEVDVLFAELDPLTITSTLLYVTPKEPIIIAIDSSVLNFYLFGDGSEFAMYQFDNDVTDLGGNYDGTPTAITYEAGHHKEQAIFNGDNSSDVDLTSFYSSFKTLDDYTFTFFITPDSSSASYNTIIFSNYHYITSSEHYGLFFQLNSNGTITVYHYGGGSATSLVSITACPISTTTHVAITSNNGYVKIYINGILDAESQLAVLVWRLSQDVKIGAYSPLGYSQNFLRASLDTLRAFRRELTQLEVIATRDETTGLHVIVEVSEAILLLSEVLSPNFILSITVEVVNPPILSIVMYQFFSELVIVDIIEFTISVNEPTTSFLTVPSILLNIDMQDVVITTNVHTPDEPIVLTIKPLMDSSFFSPATIRMNLFANKEMGSPFYHDNNACLIEIKPLEPTQISSNVATQDSKLLLDFTQLEPESIGGSLQLKFVIPQPFVVNELITTFQKGVGYPLVIHVAIIPLEPFLMLGALLKVNILSPNHIGSSDGFFESGNIAVNAPINSLRIGVNYLGDLPVNIKAYGQSLQLITTVNIPTLQEVIHPRVIEIKIKILSNIAQPLRYKKVAYIDDYELISKLYWSENYSRRTHIAERDLTIDGSTINSILPIRKYSNRYEAMSKDGIMTLNSEVEVIKNFIDTSPHKLTFDDGSVEDIMFDLLSTPINIKQVYEGADYSYITLRVLL